MTAAPIRADMPPLPDEDLRIEQVRAWAISFPVPPEHSVRLGVGRSRKRDAVVVKVVTQGGLVGWGEAHHGQAHSSVAHLLQHAIAPAVIGQDAGDVVGTWQRVYQRQLAAQGLGAAAVIALSGIDMALWDIRARAAGWPLWRLLGGGRRRIPAYAGGVALGWQEPAAMAEEARRHVEDGYRAVKLRIGDTVERDLARVRAVREAVGSDVAILCDANSAYDLEAARRVIPVLDELAIGWLEEPFSAHDDRRYALARAFGRLPFAAGENHYTRYDFNRLVEGRAVEILQPDCSKTGGVTETLRIAAMASAHKLAVHPHCSMTGINHAATLHVLAAIDNGGYFEADVSRGNLFRDALVATPFRIDADGCVAPPEGPGLGVEVDETFIAEHPAIEGPAYV